MINQIIHIDKNKIVLQHSTSNVIFFKGDDAFKAAMNLGCSVGDDVRYSINTNRTIGGYTVEAISK